MGGKFAAIPVIALTANAVSDARVQFDNAGMNDFLAKPIEAQKMAQILEKWLPPEKIETK